MQNRAIKLNPQMRRLAMPLIEACIERNYSKVEYDVTGNDYSGPVFNIEAFDESLERFGPIANQEDFTAFMTAGMTLRKPAILASVLKSFPEKVKSEETIRHMLAAAVEPGWEAEFDALYAGARDLFPQSEAFHALEMGGSVERFMAAGTFDAAERDKHGNTPLHIAAQAGNREGFLEVLDDPKTEVSARNAAGVTSVQSLMRGCSFERAYKVPDMIEAAHEAGCDFTGVDEKGRTLAHDFVVAMPKLAWRWDETPARVGKALHAAGVDFSAPDHEGHRPLDLDLAQLAPGHIATLARLGAAPSNPNNEVVRDACLRSGDGDALLALEKNGSSWREDLGGEQAAFYAIVMAQELQETGPIEAMKGAGVSFDVRNEVGDSPISLARDIGCSSKTVNMLTKMKRETISADIQAKVQARIEARETRASDRKRSGDAR